MNFKELGIKEEIFDALTGMGITEPTDIQVKVMPEIIKGLDIIGISKTGSGKTIGFGAPIMNVIKPGHGIQELIVVPVRELAEQVSTEIQKFAKTLNLKVIAVYGGVSLGPQTDNLRRAEMVVGTPGRLLDHLHRHSINLSKLKVIILDEADKMITFSRSEEHTSEL